MNTLLRLPRSATSGLVVGGLATTLAPLLGTEQAITIGVLFAGLWLITTILRLHVSWLGIGALLSAASITIVGPHWFALAWLPIAVALAVATWKNFPPKPQRLEPDQPQWGYLIAGLLMYSGLINFGLMSLKLPTWQPGCAFAAAMLLTWLTAPTSHRAYRRYPVSTLVSIPILTTIVGVLALSDPPTLVLIGAITSGIILGLHRGILTPLFHTSYPNGNRKATAIFSTMMLTQGAFTGALFTDAQLMLILFISVTQALAAIIVLERSRLT